jgi:hypothetical protein
VLGLRTAASQVVGRSIRRRTAGGSSLSWSARIWSRTAASALVRRRL